MLLIKVHAFFALLSGLGFLIRGVGHIRQDAWVQRKWIRITPHIVDTGLLMSAITLLFVLEVSPLTDWVLAKVIALVIYVFLGVMSFRIAKTRQRKILFWVLAIFVFIYILAVAKTHLVLPWLSLI